jgi:predicted dehydrogenase
MDMKSSGNSGINSKTNRREFITRSAGITIAGVSASRAVSRGAYAAGSDVLRIGLIGCGGRGTGAVNDALQSKDQVKLVAMADVFEDRLKRSYAALNELEEIEGRIEVPESHMFTGFDSYKKILESDCDIVILATPPGFRPFQYAAAVEAGKHIFMEKPCCVDGPGFRKVMEANKLADSKNLKVVVGLQRRHQKSYLQGIRRVHDGEVGDIILIRTYFNMPGGGHSDQRKPDEISELEYQIRRWGMFTWLSGDHIVEQAVHEIDIANWMKKDETPIKANGMGGRQVRTGPGNGQIYDHHFIEYIYADGSRHYAQAKQQPGGWSHVSDNVHGTKGTLTVGSGPYGVGGSMDYQGGEQRAQAMAELGNPYLQEHQDLFDAIKKDTPLNDGYHGAKSSMTAVLGRIATYSGDEVTWEEAVNSEFHLAPGIENFDLNSEPPVLPDEDGNYPIAMPGTTRGR